eukprot:jgi/Chrzof1/9318/UNPLg00287.t1
MDSASLKRAEEAERKRRYRAKLSDAQTAELRARDADAKAAKREARASAEKAAGNEKDKLRMRVKRAQESPLQRQQRLAGQAQRTAWAKYSRTYRFHTGKALLRTRWCSKYVTYVYMLFPGGCANEDFAARRSRLPPRWKLLYERAAEAPQALITAKHRYQKKPTAAAHAQLEQLREWFDAELMEACAGQQLCQCQGGTCPSYAEWRRACRESEERNARWAKERDLNDQAGAVVRALTREQPQQREHLLQKANDFLKQWHSIAEQEFQSTIQLIETLQIRRQLPAHQQSLQSQLEHLQLMKTILQEPGRLQLSAGPQRCLLVCFVCFEQRLCSTASVMKLGRCVFRHCRCTRCA